MTAPPVSLISDQLPDAAIAADRDGTIVAWNHAAESIFGHTSAHAIGQPLDIIIPDDLRAAHWKGFDHAMQTGELRFDGVATRTRAVDAHGSRVYVDLSFGLIRQDNAIIGAIAIARLGTGKRS